MSHNSIKQLALTINQFGQKTLSIKQTLFDIKQYPRLTANKHLYLHSTSILIRKTVALMSL